MRASHHLEPAINLSRAASRTKRKNPDCPEHYHPENHKKSRNLASRTKNLTVKPHRPNPKFPNFNRFQPIQSSYSSRSRDKKPSRIINREWVYSSREFSDCEDNFVVVSYNILGVENASKHPDLYFRVPPKFLEWDRRKKLICREINKYNAGILCFQEVDRYNDLDDLLQKDGFRGIYKARTGEAYDGCAIFWKNNLFTLLHDESIEFQSFGLRNNVAQLCVLKMTKDQSKSAQASKTALVRSRSLVVGNIHVLFNPNRGDIKLGQVRLFLEKAYRLSQEWGNIPVILGGDLNSIPQSAIYQYMTSSELNVLLHDRRNISGQIKCPQQHKAFRSQNEMVARPFMYGWSDEELRIATGSEEVTRLQHKLKLYSAYLGVAGKRGSRDACGEPVATSYHSKFMGTVDYIWHTEELIPRRVLETVPHDILRRTAGLPNERWGSDHLALVCELAFVDDGNGA